MSVWLLLIHPYAIQILILIILFTFAGLRTFPFAAAFPPFTGEGGGEAAGTILGFLGALGALGPSWAALGGFSWIPPRFLWSSSWCIHGNTPPEAIVTCFKSYKIPTMVITKSARNVLMNKSYFVSKTNNIFKID